MSDVLQRLRRAKPYLTQDLIGICALVVIFFGAAQASAFI